MTTPASAVPTRASAYATDKPPLAEGGDAQSAPAALKGALKPVKLAPLAARPHKRVLAKAQPRQTVAAKAQPRQPVAAKAKKPPPTLRFRPPREAFGPVTTA